jgi:hypothetical protein
MIVGRKRAGKTALFSQLRNEKRSNARNIVVDLKPKGYQLIRLKEDVLDYLAEGARTRDTPAERSAISVAKQVCGWKAITITVTATTGNLC